mgnify:CR=1 FL=1
MLDDDDRTEQIAAVRGYLENLFSQDAVEYECQHYRRGDSFIVVGRSGRSRLTISAMFMEDRTVQEIGSELRRLDLKTDLDPATNAKLRLTNRGLEVDE